MILATPKVKSMGRMHARRKGRSGSRKPLRIEKPEWVDMSEEEIVNKILELAKEGYSQAMIGTILRDQYGVPDVKLMTGKSIGKILEGHGMASSLPEDLMALMKKAVKINAHLQNHPRDLGNRRGLQLVEAKIRRLVKYYKRVGKLPADWKYSLKEAELLVK